MLETLRAYKKRNLNDSKNLETNEYLRTGSILKKIRVIFTYLLNDLLLKSKFPLPIRPPSYHRDIKNNITIR